MEITASRTGQRLVLTLTGRMDGAGARQVTAAIRQNLTDHDQALIFDLGGVEYLSSAGLRVFQECAQKMKERRGRIAICRLQDFVRKLFVSGGFLRILEEFPDSGSALAATAGSEGPADTGTTMAGAGWTLMADHHAGAGGVLHVSGNLPAIINGTVTAADLRESVVKPVTFAIGIGALAATKKAAIPLTGEMMEAGGAVCWIPADGNLTMDFFTPGDLASSGMNVYTLYRVSFTGPFTDVLRIAPETPEGLPLSMVYDAVLTYLRKRYPDFRGVCAVVIKGTIRGVCSADLKTPILAAAAGRTGPAATASPGAHSMMELPTAATVADTVSAVDVHPKYGGDTLVAIGYGIDREAAQKAFGPETLAPLVVANPRASSAGPFLYT
ncbi:STAS domain-containing protein, partial [Methanoregula sp.]|uniref:STAS domain-containing protein n=1 Tax=Methanoregula sp. TaxID=2052170 RepID=UPI000CC19BF0